MLRGNLAELEAVVAVANHGGFRAAAREMGISSSAISQAIAALEARLGVRLFNRNTRSVTLSAAGEQFLSEIGPALGSIRGAIEGAGEHQATPVGTLRLNMARGAAVRLQPLITAYLRQYPQMTVEVVTEDRLVDVNAQGFDAGVRLRDAVPLDMIAVPVGGEIRSVIVGTPAVLAGRPLPRTPADLAGFPCIRYRLSSGAIYRWELSRGAETLTLDAQGPLVLDDNDLVHRAVLDGLGLGYLVDWLVEGDLAAGRLIQLLPEWTPPFPGLCLYYPGRRHVPAKLRAFVALVRQGLPHQG